MRPKKISSGLNLSNTDIEAILCALPLVAEVSAGSPQQDELNAIMCASAAQKLSSHSTSLLPNEVRVISAAITIAVLLLSGQSSDMLSGVDPSRKAELSKYLFTLNRLDPLFQDLADRLCSLS